MKILVLSCNTGGGHNSCAKYIKEEFNSQGVSCDVKDYIELAGKKASKIIEKMYLDSTKGNGRVFKTVYKMGELYNKTNIKSPVYLLNKLSKNRLNNFIIKNNYDLIICTHLFPSMGLTELKKEKDIKFINVATDYECIPFWNETNPDFFVIPNKLLEKDFILKGFNKKRLLSFGIPVSTVFKDNIKSDKLPNDKEIVLLTSGSMGFGKMYELVQEILKELPNIYLVVVCGNNKKLKHKISNIKNSNLIVKGFVKNMNYYIKSCDIAITKPGGLTTSEIVTLRKPLIHTMPIPGVETYNALFFENNKMSLKATNIEETVSKLKLLLNDKNLQKSLIKNQIALINENSAKDLVDFAIKKYKK